MVKIEITATSSADIAKLIRALQALNGEESTVTSSQETPVIKMETKEERPVTTPEIKKEIVKEAEKTTEEAPKGPVVIPAPTKEAATEGVTLSKETLRSRTATLIKAGKRDEIAAKLKELGAGNVSSLKEADYQVYNDFLTTLETPTE